MKKYSEEYRHLNNLLSALYSARAIELVDDYYKQFGNEAPGELLRDYIEECQTDLDNAEVY